MVSLLWKSLTPILFILGMVLTRLSVFVLLKSDLCAHDCAQTPLESENRAAAEIIQMFLSDSKFENDDRASVAGMFLCVSGGGMTHLSSTLGVLNPETHW